MPIREYFKQWQQINCDPEQWQKREGPHPGVLSACEWINQHATNILDVGCGVARDSNHIKIPYHGIDITPKFVATAHKHDASVQRATATHLPFQDRTFDLVYCHNLLLHLPPGMWQQVLTEMIRVANRWILTVEPEWETENNFHPRETLDENPDNILIFFSNTYSRQEMIEFAQAMNVDYQFTCGYDEKRSSFLKKHIHWQVTIYTKEVKQHDNHHS